MGDSLAIVRENERKKEYLKWYIYSVRKAQRLKEQIAVEMDYNYRWVLRLHGRALKNFEISEISH